MAPFSLQKTMILILRMLFLGKQNKVQRRQLNDLKTTQYNIDILQLRITNSESNVLYAIKSLCSCGLRTCNFQNSSILTYSKITFSNMGSAKAIVKNGIHTVQPLTILCLVTQHVPIPMVPPQYSMVPPQYSNEFNFSLGTNVGTLQQGKYPCSLVLFLPVSVM
jgi:hypothetical protein